METTVDDEPPTEFVKLLLVVVGPVIVVYTADVVRPAEIVEIVELVLVFVE